MKVNRLILAAGLCITSMVGAGKLSGYRDAYVGHGPTMPPDPGEPIVAPLRDGLPLPECNPCPWYRAGRNPHGPTMPPDPGEPLR